MILCLLVERREEFKSNELGIEDSEKLRLIHEDELCEKSVRLP